jgi:hypothetical protein
MPGAAASSAERRCDIFSGGNQVQPYLNPTIEFFDRASVPREIADLLGQDWESLLR